MLLPFFSTPCMYLKNALRCEVRIVMVNWRVGGVAVVGG